MASRIWQLSVLVTLNSLILGTAIEAAFGQADLEQAANVDSSRVSYNRQALVNQKKQLVGFPNELAVAANSQAANFMVNNNDRLRQQQVQPSVYHSIIDRSTASTAQLASPVQATAAATGGDLNTAAGHHHGHAHGKYYEYREVPKKKTWKFGYKRGNHKHTIERHEHGKNGKHPHFKTKVKWHDKKSKGKGIHLWDYNHHDKKHYHHG